MAFCTSCGATLEAGKRFCSSCGSPLAGAAPAATPPAPAPAPVQAAAPAPAPQQQAAQPQKKGGGVLKIVLIVLGVLFLLFVIIGGAIGYFVYRGYQKAKAAVEQIQPTTTSSGTTTVNTPWGKVETNTGNAQEALDQMGIDAYPGATVVPGSVSTSTLGNLKTAAIKYTTSDPPDKVYDFYRSAHKDAMTASSGDKYTVMFTGKDKALVTVTAEPKDGQTEIDIASVGGESGGSTDSQPSSSGGESPQ